MWKTEKRGKVQKVLKSADSFPHFSEKWGKVQKRELKGGNKNNEIIKQVYYHIQDKYNLF